MAVYDDVLCYKPIKFQPIYLQRAAVGVETIPGNRTEASGRQFFAVMTNLLQESFKLTSPDDETDFGTFMKGAGLVMGFTFPGLDYEPSSQDFQHIQYMGNKKNKLNPWAEVDSIDYDFDGNPDAGSYSETLPLQFYLATGAFSDTTGGDAVDYSGIWQGEFSRLSSTDSLWQTIASGDYTNLSSFRDRMMLLLGLLETKRRWVFGMSNVGINPFDASSQFDASVFENVGGVNAQVMWEYIYQRTEVVGRMKEVFGAGTTNIGMDFYQWVKNTVKPQLEAHLAGIDKTARDAAIAVFAGGTKTVPVIEAIQQELQNVDAAGLVPYRVLELEAQLEQLKNELAALTDQAAIDAKLNEIENVVTEITQLQDDVNLIVNNFWNEFSMESACPAVNQPVDLDMDETELSAIKSTFDEYMKKPMSYTIGVMSNNMLFRQINRINKEKVELEKAEKREAKRREEKAKYKRIAEAKKQQKVFEAKIAQRQRAEKKRLDKPKGKVSKNGK